MHEISEMYENVSGVYVSVSKGDGAETWGTGDISFTSGGGNGMKYSLFHRPLGGVGPKRQRPTLYSLSIKHFTLQWSTRWWTHAQYLHTVERVYLSGLVWVWCLLLTEFFVSVCERESNGCAITCASKCVCIQYMGYHRCLVFFCWLGNNFHKRKPLSQVKYAAEATSTFIPEVYQYCKALCSILQHMRWSGLSVNTLGVGECARVLIGLGYAFITLNKYEKTQKLCTQWMNNENYT